MADDIPTDAERYAAGLPVAGRWDRDPMREHPGSGTWIDPGPTAAPEAGEPAADDPVARLRAANSGRAGKPGNWSADVTRPTVHDVRRDVR